MQQNLALEAAQNYLMAQVEAVASEKCALRQAGGRVLAADCLAACDFPPFNRADMDGYVLREAGELGATYSVAALLGAGDQLTELIPTGVALRVMTGAALPADFGYLVKQECLEQVTEDTIRLTTVTAEKRFISARGCEISAGQLLAEKGSLLTPELVALLACGGCAEVEVYRRVRVGILSTGSELVELEQGQEVGKIFNSSSYYLQGWCEKLGAEVHYLGIAQDNLAALSAQIAAAATKFDFLLTTGGTGGGAFDFSRRAIEQGNGVILLEQVEMMPGRHVIVGQVGDSLVFALSGKPGAAAVGFQLLFRPVLAAKQGRRNCLLRTVSLPLAAGLTKRGKQRKIINAAFEVADGRLCALPRDARLGAAAALATADLMLDIPSQVTELQAGADVKAFIL